VHNIGLISVNTVREITLEHRDDMMVNYKDVTVRAVVAAIVMTPNKMINKCT
jgi:hypothetical protein